MAIEDGTLFKDAEKHRRGPYTPILGDQMLLFSKIGHPKWILSSNAMGFSSHKYRYFVIFSCKSTFVFPLASSSF